MGSVADLGSLRAAILWARAQGWRPVRRGWARQIGETTIQVVYRIQGGTGCVKVFRGPPEPAQLASVFNLRSVQQAIDLLAALSYLPRQLSSAYVSGRRDGISDAEGLTEQAIEDGVTTQIELLLARFDTAEGMRTLGDLIERHPHGVALSTVPFERRNQLAAIADAAGSMLGVDQA